MVTVFQFILFVPVKVIAWSFVAYWLRDAEGRTRLTLKPSCSIFIVISFGGQVGTVLNAN